ncbi:MAG: enoyl-[acyl-carrier-protein] reductase FabL [Anaerolineae bacterium]|nr:enoyl-[acyl-carrier-protein] reductase FabL [Anaerolineae bacterium]
MYNKVALITGSSRGIGRAIALELARQGADIVIHYLRKRHAANEVVTEIEGLGRRAIAVGANLADSDKVGHLFDVVEETFGRCDIFIGNAATGTPKDALELTNRHWDWTMDVNARSMLHCIQRVIPLMESKGWGRIVTISSPGSTRVLPHYAAIGMSKAVVEALTRYLAVELASEGIIVNAVSPGLVETKAITAFPVDLQATLEFAIERTPAGRLVTPEDIARTVAFLCSDANTMIVGQTITIDGGYQLLA